MNYGLLTELLEPQERIYMDNTKYPISSLMKVVIGNLPTEV